MGTRAGLDRCRKFCPHRDLISGPSSPQQVSIPTTLPQPTPKKSIIYYKTQSRSGRSNGTHFNHRMFACLLCSVVGHLTNSNVKSRVSLTDDDDDDDDEIPLK